MEKNLAKLLREVQYRSCGSDVGDDREENPVNPFMKRVFEKRMRGSSVASENINPNFSSVQTDHNDEADHSRIQSIIEKGHSMLEKLQKSTIDRMKQIRRQNFGTAGSKDASKLLLSLQKMMCDLSNHIEKYCSSNNMPLPQESSESICHMQTYQCPTASSKCISSSLKGNDSHEKKRRKAEQSKGRHLGGSMVSQTNNKAAQSKSVYESVLEERRNRRTKQSRIV